MFNCYCSCPFSDCGKKIDVERDERPTDLEVDDLDCPHCERPLRITYLVLSLGIKVDCSPRP